MTTKAPDLLPCDTCGLPVTVDAVVANDVWARISPTHDEGGYLCPTCVARRLADIEGWPAVRMTDSRADLHAAVVAERDALKSTVRHILDYLAEPAEDTLSGMRHDLRFIANTCRAALAKQEPKE